VNPPVTQVSTNQAGTSFAAGALVASTTYFWRVDSKNSAGTTPGVIWSFTTGAASPPSQAANPSPANGATGVNGGAVTLSWGVAGGATGYDVFFGTVNPPVTQVSTNQAGTSFAAGVLLAGTQYFWRIDSKNASGTTTGVIWSFTTLALPAQAANPAPTDGALDVNPAAVTLSWSAASGATGYDIFLDTVNPPNGKVSNNQAGTSFPTGLLADSTQYFWRVNSRNAAGATTGAVWTFTTLAPVPPGQATNPNPADGANDVNSAAVTLGWGAASGATGYDVFLDTANPPVQKVSSSQAGTSFAAGALAGSTQYFWRVDSKNGAGTTTGIVWTFTTLAVPPPGQAANPNPASPSSGINPSAVTLGWDAASGATGYDLFLDTVDPPVAKVSNNQAGTSFAAGVLAGNITYFWRVDSRNAGGTTTGLVWTFTTGTLNPPAQATNPGPPNGVSGVPHNGSINLQWTAAVGATSYDVYLDTVNPPTTLVSGDQSGTSFSPGVLTPSTAYFWRIDSKNAAGTTTGVVWGFATGL
jgi:hypothetical protein